MSLRLRPPLIRFYIGALLLILGSGLYGQAPTAASRRITGYVDDQERVVLRGQRHPLARPEFSRGAVPAGMRLERMILTLQPEEAQQRELDALLASQQDPSSPEYHRWLTPEEFGRRFGVSEWDFEQVVNWLQARGFDVEPVGDSRRTIVFSGTAGQTASAFHTPIQRYEVEGEVHYANAADPEIPEALAAVVRGVVSLHDFRARPLHVAALPEPALTSGSAHYMAPADFAAIYNLRPLYSAAVDARGQAIAVAGRSNIKASDIESFRSLFGLPAGSLQVVLNGADPGVVAGDEQFEAQLDVEWAGAVATGAQVQLVTSASTRVTDGVTLSAQYIVSHNVAPVVSLSFGSCEAAMGTAGNQFWNSLWQQAAAQGMTVLVSSGDSGAAGCDDASDAAATSGRGVNGLCSSPYVTCVGGTQFSDTANPALYWSTTNGSAYGSATGYIPEAVWNTSGTSGSGLWAGGGGASSVYAKPGWQTGAGVPADNHRYVPDVSLSGSTHDGYMVVLNGQLCAAGGTSASAPALAGLMALAVQKQGARIGNANPAFYGLAAMQAMGGAAVFHDVATGNNSVPGLTGYSAGAGYDPATGLGSVDATQLVNHWSDGSLPVPAFQVSASVAAVAVTQGGNASAVLTVTVSGGFRNDVTLTAGTLPAGLTATFSPAKIASPGSGSSTLTLAASTQAVPGNYNLTVTATAPGMTQTVPLAVTIGARCSYSLAKTTQTATATAGNYFVAVSATAGCGWTAAAGVSWMAIAIGGSGTGNGTVTYSVAANSAASPRTGSLTIAGLTLSVTQDAAPATATFTLNPLTASFGAAGGTATAALTASSGTASWTAVSNATWITITSGGSGVGSKTIAYTVAANTTTSARSGTLTIAGLTLSVTQDAAPATATFTLNPLTASFGAAGGTATAALTASSGTASWTAVSNATWITITGGGSGVGSKTIAYIVAANTTTSVRSGTLTIAGLTLSVTQDATPATATFTLNPLTASFGAPGGTATAALTASSGTASWTAVSNTAWITITSGGSGVGSRTIAYTVAANATTSARSGTLKIAGLTLTVTQAAMACSYSISLGPVTPGKTGYAGSVTVTAASGCAWTAVSNVAWITVSSGAAGSGNGSVRYAAAPNTTATSRTGTLTVAGYAIRMTEGPKTSSQVTLSPATPTN